MSESKTNTPVTDKDKFVSVSHEPAAMLLRLRRPLVVLAHITAFAASLMFAFLLANNMAFKREWFVEQYPVFLFFFVTIKFIVFAFFKQYRGWWRYVGISDLTSIMRSSLISTLIISSLWYSLLQIDSLRRGFPVLATLPQGVVIADMVATIVLLAGMRMVVRLYYEEFRTVETGRLKRFLIIGAGNAGEALLREIHRMTVAQYEVIGFVDDDRIKQGINIHGIPVLGTVDKLPEICRGRNIEEIAIAVPSATHKQLRRVIQACEGTKIRFRTVPSITDIASGKFRVSQIRDVDINDLLGRETVELDLDSIEKFAKDKTILVTGAGGSIGSEMCRQLCNFMPNLLLLVEQAENPLFHVENELRKSFPRVAIKAVICDITDKIRVEQVQAASMGKGGEIFVLDMGEPVKIVDLARELITLSGFKPGEDIGITFTGLRPGEKLFEELSIKGEDMLMTRHPKIGIWQNIPMDRNKLHAAINELVAIAQRQDYDEIVRKIRQLVPEYIGSNNEKNQYSASAPAKTTPHAPKDQKA